MRELVVATLKYLGAGALMSIFAGIGTYYMAEFPSVRFAIAMACIPLAVVLINSFPVLVQIWKLWRAK